ncbi:MAG: hypothetical protein PHE15_02815 [Dehalococcoidales bacterium]|nr:hypothetical protein [Dehalococcoidales bacterium]
MCKHLNGEIKEETIAYAEWEILNGEVVDDGGYVGHSSPTGRITFVCSDCGMEKVFSKNRPKWLQKYYDSALSTDAQS